MHKIVYADNVTCVLLYVIFYNNCIPQSWLMWLASGLGILHILPSAIARSVAAKVVDPDELGRVFAVYSATMGVLPLFMSPLGTTIFNFSLNHHMDPGLVFYGASSIFIMAAFVAMYIDTIWWSNKQLLDVATNNT